MMGKFARRFCLGVGVTVIAVAVPGAALAGKKVTSGQQTLQIKTRLSSAKAGAGHVRFGFTYQYKSTTPGQQPPYNAKTITLVMPRGLALNPAAAPACKRSQIDAAKGDLSKCPAKTIVGHGTVQANAAPTIAAPITGTATVYNAVNDTGESHEPKGTRNLVLWVKTSIGVNQVFPFRVIRGAGRPVELQASLTKPAQPGVSPGSFTIQSVDLSIAGSGKRSLITNPKSCSGSWPFALRVVNYFGQPGITAHDQVKCRP